MKYTVKVNSDGNTYWYKEGTEILHREGDLPAIEWSNGYKVYYLNGKCHRENGPAIENANGTKAYYFNGVRYSEEEYLKKIKKNSSCEDVVIVNMKYTVEVIRNREIIETYWYKEGTEILHREEDLPAVEYSNGYKVYFINGKYHRENGPAIEYPNGHKQYYLNNMLSSEKECFNKSVKKDC